MSRAERINNGLVSVTTETLNDHLQNTPSFKIHSTLCHIQYAVQNYLNIVTYLFDVHFAAASSAGPPSRQILLSFQYFAEFSLFQHAALFRNCTKLFSDHGLALDMAS